MRGLTCDVCGHIQLSDPGDSSSSWTSISLGIKMMGSPDYQDLCPECGVWLIDILDEQKKKKGKWG